MCINVGGGRKCLTFFKVLLSLAQLDEEPVSTFLNLRKVHAVEIGWLFVVYTVLGRNIYKCVYGLCFYLIVGRC